jgi:cytochrome c-type biogenesis protein CcmF
MPVFFSAEYNIWVALAVVLSTWLVVGLFKDLLFKVRSGTSIAAGLRRITPSYWGMFLAHMGFAIALAGVVVSTQYSVEIDLKMKPGDTRVLANYEFELVDVGSVLGPNFTAEEARVTVSYDGDVIANLAPQKRRYLASGDVLTEAAIDPGLFRDLYVAMGEPIGNDGAWAMRLHYMPLVRWIWLGAIFMGFGGLLTVTDKRYRRRVKSTETAVIGSAGVPV